MRVGSTDPIPIAMCVTLTPETCTGISKTKPDILINAQTPFNVMGGYMTYDHGPLPTGASGLGKSRPAETGALLILYYTTSYYTILYHTILYYIILYYTILD